MVAKAGAEVMKAKGYDPIVGIMSVIEEKKRWPEDEAVAKGLMSRDWEPADEPGYLQPSVSVRLRAHTTLAEYGYSRVKAAEVGEVNVGVQVIIEGSGGKVVETNGKGVKSDFGVVEVVMEGGR